MKTILQWLATAVIFAVVGYFIVIIATPKVLMAGAMRKIGANGRAVNQFVFAPRTTEASRQVVRPSPDLVYSTCVYDLSKGPLRVHVTPWTTYVSVSVFQANSDNIFVLNDRQSPGGFDFVLATRGQATPAGARVVISPSSKGIVLDRRLAPTEEAFQKADEARRGDVCQTIKPAA
jgi:uncharacterized membrane protein